MSTPERERMAGELQMAMQRSTVYTVLLHHATASKAGMNVTDAQCVNALTLDGPQTPGQLAQLMGITTGGAITAVIDRLERAGYVRRTRDPDDRRRVIVELVEENVAHFARYFEPIARAFNERLASYTDDQVALLLDWIRHNNAVMPAVIEEIRKLP
ncbi:MULTISPECIES: MarR family winged helix-turn-helix transcriptional regulator [Actinomadura]|uniref:DNA-binding transcriptional regulator, MarR family n=1 Tax=Actinomadura madurae TaxID=1993 RepID=A0A1I5CLS5_9ACTN|nr:MarR family transcriptional regulator [Actinomadura madurae]SFN87826.1 DNA-binding transcriptional regulator, MarR family [Actinomadura madurae]SPT50663.1 DNA-binding transcriptional repressor MarR [Actinomadura madurae]